MIMKIGTLVLCHLIVGGGGQTQQEAKIRKVPGIIKEITEVDEIEQVGNDYAVKRKKAMILVQPTDENEIFKVSANACRPVVDEETHLDIVKQKAKEKAKSKKAAPKDNKEEKKNDEAGESTKSAEPKQKEESTDAEKEKLLEGLE